MERAGFTLDDYGYSDNPAFLDWCLGQAVQALIDDNKEEEAILLLACRLSWEVETWDDAKKRASLRITIHGPMSVIRKLTLETLDNDTLYDIEFVVMPHLDPVREILGYVLERLEKVMVRAS